MATSKIVSHYLRRRTQFSLHRNPSLLNPNFSSSPISRFSPHTFIPSPPSTTSFRFYSPDSVFNHELNSVTESELRNLGFIDGSESVANCLVEDSIFPIRAVVNLLDGYHALTGLPWWIVIASATVALRVTLLPVIILQLQKLKQIGEAIPKLPPPLPPLFSGKSYVDQLSLFRRERQALGCPSFLWFIASHTVQIPCFVLWMVSIRRMAMADFHGFDAGGILWFQDLTQSPSGVLGCVFPFLVAGLHFCNVQMAFKGSSLDKDTGVFQLLAKWYKKYLQLLPLPLLFAAFHVPQASLVYWLTNSSLTLTQHVYLQHPFIRQKMGLPIKEASHASAESEKGLNVLVDAPIKKGSVSAFDLSPLQLVHQSLPYLSKRKTEKAIILLRLAVEKDPECYRAWTLLGNVMIEKGLINEASVYAECAIAEISLLEQPYNAETVDYLIQASVIAGDALYRQGKLPEALVHLERVRDLKEPEDPVAKDRYYEGLVFLARVLLKEGRKDEAARYLRLAMAHDPEYSVFLKNLSSEKNADAAKQQET